MDVCVCVRLTTGFDYIWKQPIILAGISTFVCVLLLSCCVLNAIEIKNISNNLSTTKKTQPFLHLFMVLPY